jgi:hypothetical protein
MIIADIPEDDRTALKDLTLGIDGSSESYDSYLESVEEILLKHFAPGTNAMKILFPIFSCASWCQRSSRRRKQRDPIESMRGRWGLTETQAKILRRILSTVGIGILGSPIANPNKMIMMAPISDGITADTGLR